MIQRLAQHTDTRVALVVGGLSLQAQATALRARPEIVVATPVHSRCRLVSTLHCGKCYAKDLSGRQCGVDASLMGRNLGSVRGMACAALCLCAVVCMDVVSSGDHMHRRLFCPPCQVPDPAL